MPYAFYLPLTNPIELPSPFTRISSRKMKLDLTFGRVVRRMSEARKGLAMDAKYNRYLDNPYLMTAVNSIAFAMWFWISFALLS